MANTQELDFSVWRRQPAGTSSQPPVSYPGSSSKKSSGSSSPSNQPQYVEEDLAGSQIQTKPDGVEVRLYDGVFEEIEEGAGFQFNKKCRIKVKVDLPKGSTDRKKVTFNTIVSFDGEEEDLCQTLEGFIEEVKSEGDKKQYQAVAEMNLFYGEKYYKAWLQDNTVKCFYKFRATHPNTKSSVESSELTMPCGSGGNSITLRFVDDLGDAIDCKPFEVIVKGEDGSNITVQSGNNGTVAVEPENDISSFELSLPQQTIDLFRDSLGPKWKSSKTDNSPILKEDGKTVVIYLKENPPSRKIAINSEDNEPYVISIQPYVAMARMRGMYFDTNKCFMLPTAIPGIKNMVDIYTDNSNCKLLVVGHTDTTGETAYNNQLSLERAESIQAYLTDDVEAWLKWYGTGISEKKRWGDNEDSLMISSVLSENDGSGQDSLLDFQIWHNKKIESEGSGKEKLEEDGIMGPATRSALIKRYMGHDNTTLPEDIGIEVHGCGESFPLDDSEKELDSSPEDSKKDTTDRRVELFFFDKEVGIQPPPPGKISSKGNKEYPIWRKKASIVEVGTPLVNALHIQLSDENGTLCPKGTKYKVIINDIVRQGVLTEDGYGVETGINFAGATEATILWGETIEWNYKHPDKTDDVVIK